MLNRTKITVLDAILAGEEAYRQMFREISSLRYGMAKSIKSELDYQCTMLINYLAKCQYSYDWNDFDDPEESKIRSAIVSTQNSLLQKGRYLGVPNLDDLAACREFLSQFKDSNGNIYKESNRVDASGNTIYMVANRLAFNNMVKAADIDKDMVTALWFIRNHDLIKMTNAFGIADDDFGTDNISLDADEKLVLDFVAQTLFENFYDFIEVSLAGKDTNNIDLTVREYLDRGYLVDVRRFKWQLTNFHAMTKEDLLIERDNKLKVLDGLEQIKNGTSNSSSSGMADMKYVRDEAVKTLFSHFSTKGLVTKSGVVRQGGVIDETGLLYRICCPDKDTTNEDKAINKLGWKLSRLGLVGLIYPKSDDMEFSYQDFNAGDVNIEANDFRLCRDYLNSIIELGHDI